MRHLDDQHFKGTRAEAVPVWDGMKWKRVEQPRKGFWEPATCEAYGCSAFEKGFKITLDLSPMMIDKDLLKLNQRRNYYFDRECGKPANLTLEEGGKVTYHWPAGTECFKIHQLPIMRDPIFIHKGGLRKDWQQLEYTEFFDRNNEALHQLRRRQQRG